MQKDLLIWINCYGGWAPELRHPIETIGYSQYLDGVVAALTPLDDRVRATYVCGGMYDANGQIESETTRAELLRRLELQGIVDLNLIADTEVLSTISIAKRLLTVWREQFSDCLPLLFCDRVRAEVNAYTLTYYAKQQGIVLPPMHEVIVPLERLDTHPHSTPEFQRQKLEEMKKQGLDAIDQQIISIRQAENAALLQKLKRR